MITVRQILALFEGMNIRNSLCATHQRTYAWVGLASTYVNAVTKLCAALLPSASAPEVAPSSLHVRHHGFQL